MAKQQQPLRGQPGQVEGSPATAPDPENARPYEGGEPKRHPDTGEPQGVDDPPGDPARQPQPGDRDPKGGSVAAKGDDPKPMKANRVKRTVSVTGQPTLEVEFDEPEVESGQDAKGAVRRAAIEAYKQRLGIWALPAEPDVSEGE